jgi:hypothetical protein
MKLMGRRGALLLVAVGVLAALATGVRLLDRTARRPAAIAPPPWTGARSSPPCRPPEQLNAVTTVLVGSQVSGQMRDVLVDFNTRSARIS